MTQFRFCCKCVSYLRWRWRGTRRRAVPATLPMATAEARRSGAAAWRRTPAPVAAPAPPAATYRVGNFVVGQEGDPQLLGHPDIRY